MNINILKNLAEKAIAFNKESSINNENEAFIRLNIPRDCFGEKVNIDGLIGSVITPDRPALCAFNAREVLDWIESRKA